VQQMRGVHAACSRPVRRDSDKSVRQLRRKGGGVMSIEYEIELYATCDECGKLIEAYQAT